MGDCHLFSAGSPAHFPVYNNKNVLFCLEKRKNTQIFLSFHVSFGENLSDELIVICLGGNTLGVQHASRFPLIH